MRPAIRARTVLLVLICWAMANALLYCGLDWYESLKLPVKHRPSRQSLALFESSLNHSISTEVAKRSALPYRLMSPAKVKSGERYPLVAFLHGAGAKGDDNQSQLLGWPKAVGESAIPASCSLHNAPRSPTGRVSTMS